MTEQEFIIKLQENNINLTPKMIQDFRDYFELIVSYNKVMNLTGNDELEVVYERHFYDSIKIAFGKDFNSISFADVGSGAGFPAIPLKIVFPDMKLTIIDPLQKRMKFLEIVINKLQLKDVDLVVSRVEDLKEDYNEKFDIVTARAVAKLNILVELVCQIIKVNGTFIAMKGIKGKEELLEAKHALSICNLRLNDEISDELTDNFYFIKERKVDKKYPRNYGRIVKEPL